MNLSEQDRQKKLLNDAYKSNTERLRAIINPLRQSTYACDYEWRALARAFARYAEDYGSVDLNPDFQRGHVWTEQQQIHYIENALRGIVSAPAFVIQLNCPNWEADTYKGDLPHGFQCIDGLQRLTAVMRFIAGEIKAFGTLGPDELKTSAFMVMSNYRFRFEIFSFQSKKELVQHYLDLNTGGTPHSKEEIARVRALLAQS